MSIGEKLMVPVEDAMRWRGAIANAKLYGEGKWRTVLGQGGMLITRVA